jgi:hypothetical protein
MEEMEEPPLLELHVDARDVAFHSDVIVVRNPTDHGQHLASSAYGRAAASMQDQVIDH